LKTQQPAAIRFNTEAKLITSLFALYLVVLTLTVTIFGPLFTVTTPLHPVAGSLAIFVGAIVGVRASMMFGGRRNFTGRLLIFYSVALFAQAISWVVWGLFAGGKIPSGTTLIILVSGTILGQVLSSYALVVSAKEITIKLNRRLIGLILFAVAFSAALSIALAFYSQTIENLIVWSGIWSITICLQLTSSLVVISNLGKWYLARPIAYISFGYILFSILTSIVTMIQIVGHFSEADYWVVISIVQASTLFVVGLAMSQVRPMTRDSSLREGVVPKN